MMRLSRKRLNSLHITGVQTIKGLEFYQTIDRLISTEEWQNKIEFTYVENISEEFKFENTTILEPMEDFEIANELKKHHIYLTGSINEPSEIITLRLHKWLTYTLLRWWRNARVL